jgi:hypothetical protein
MKLIKISAFAFLLFSFSSCLKAKNDFAGMRTDPGEVVTAVLEKQYLTGDDNNLAFGYSIYSTFPFTGAAETPRFFTLHISQPKAKVSGSIKVKISMTPITSGVDPLPAGAVTMPAEFNIPAQGGSAFDFPVRLAVNKAVLDPAGFYGITFTITSVDQGIYSELEKSVDVYFYSAVYDARYKNTLTVVDANDLFEIDNNLKTNMVLEGLTTAGAFDILDLYSGNHAVTVANKTTGAATALFNPVYQTDPTTGKLTGVFARGVAPTFIGANLNATIDASSGWTYGANDTRVFVAKYTLTLTVSGVARVFTVSDKYEWNAPQAM